jgi:hypothetical protein
MVRRNFDKTLLDQCLTRDGAIFISHDGKLGYKTPITYQCKCGETATHQFCRIADRGGAICSISCLEHTSKRIIWNAELLNNQIKKDSAELIGEYNSKLTIDSEIHFKCLCGNEHTKGFRALVKWGGAKCKVCCDKSQQEKTKNHFMETYGVDNIAQVESIKEKRRETCLREYGVPYAIMSTAVKEQIVKRIEERTSEEIKKTSNKRRETCMIVYGVPNASQNENVKKKTKETCLREYGVISTALHPDIKKKQQESMLRNHGVKHNFQAGRLRDNRKITFMNKYGVEHPAQNQQVMERTQNNAKKYKKFVMPSGVVRNVQGYEPFALKELLRLYSEDQIKSDRKDVPRVQYEVSGKKHYHFPDIFIPHENKLVEVKSTWTYKCKISNIQQKKKACQEQGYTYEIWCYDRKGNRVEI